MGGFILKVIACSGDKDGPMVQKLGEAGIKWSTETDKFTVPLTVNISNRRRPGCDKGNSRHLGGGNPDKENKPESDDVAL